MLSLVTSVGLDGYNPTDTHHSTLCQPSATRPLCPDFLWAHGGSSLIGRHHPARPLIGRDSSSVADQSDVTIGFSFVTSVVVNMLMFCTSFGIVVLSNYESKDIILSLTI